MGLNRRRRRRRWAIALGVLAIVGGSAIVVAWVLPHWLRGRVETELITRLHRKTGLEATLEALQVYWGRLELQGLRLEGEQGDPTIRVDSMSIEIDPAALWERRIVATQASISGGEARGTQAGLDRLRHRLEPSQTQPEPAGQAGDRGHRLIPSTVVLRNFAVEINADAADLQMTVASDVDIAERSAAVQLDDVQVHRAGMSAPVVAQQVRFDLKLEGRQPVFPVNIAVRGGRAPVRDQIEVADVSGVVEVSDAAAAELAVDLTGSFGAEGIQEAPSADGQLWSARGRFRRDLSAGFMAVDMDAFELGRIPEVLALLPVVESEASTVGGHIAARFSHGVARVEGEVALQGLNIHDPLLARQPVHDVGFELSFAAELDPRARRLDLAFADIRREDVVVKIHGEVEHPQRQDGRRYHLWLDVPKVECEAVLDAIPHELVPALRGFEFAGDLQGAISLHVDYADLELLRLDSSLDFSGCRVRQAPIQASPEHLGGAFTHQIQLKDGQTRTLRMYPGSGSFTPYEAISPYLVQAVLTTEDGGFWRHHGFLPSQFEVALRRNLDRGRISLGASTITMQMVKNVLLSQERTLARKLQEMALTWHIEHQLTKQRIMELYLNAIEYGPGIYGVTAAADRYFGKAPSDLIPAEAMVLAMMLPSPVERYIHFCNGELSPRFEAKLRRLLATMHERGRLSDLDYALWKDAPITFAAMREDRGACLRTIERFREGRYTQRALTGLTPIDSRVSGEL